MTKVNDLECGSCHGFGSFGGHPEVALKLKSESILFANNQLEDNPHNLKPGMELTIPPVDGLYYEWQDGDTFETVAEKFDTTPDEIINFPGNRVT